MTSTASPSSERIRAAGLRATLQRASVLDVLALQPGHHTVETVHGWAEDLLGSMSMQATYDVLAALAEVGLVRRIETPGQPARYEARAGDNHHHFVCRTCGSTIDIDCATGAAPCLVPFELPGGFVVDEAEVTYWGQCRDCVAAAPEGSVPASSV